MQHPTAVGVGVSPSRVRLARDKPHQWIINRVSHGQKNLENGGPPQAVAAPRARMESGVPSPREAGSTPALTAQKSRGIAWPAVWEDSSAQLIHLWDMVWGCRGEGPNQDLVLL